MKAKVDQALCIGCGLCESSCPEVFKMDDNDLSQVQIDPIPDHLKEQVLEVETDCPVEAISHED